MALATPETGHAEPTELASYQDPLPPPVVSKGTAASRRASLSGAQCLSEMTRRKLDALGFTTDTLDTSEFEKAEAALTCLSLIFT